MNRFFFSLILLGLPVFCSAQGNIMTSEEYWFLVIIGVISILLFAAVFVIMLLNWLENRKSRKNKQQSPSAQDKKKELYELKQELKEKEYNLNSFKKEIEDLQKENNYLQKEKENLEKRLTLLCKKENEKSKEGMVTQNRNGVRPNNKEQNEKYTHEYDYIYLTPLEGPLVEAGPEHAVYYRAWKKDGKFFFEFVNNDRTKKAINNRTSIIEPFCEKVESSKSPDDSEMIATITPGLLNDDYTIIDKAKIEYK